MEKGPNVVRPNFFINAPKGRPISRLGKQFVPSWSGFPKVVLLCALFYLLSLPVQAKPSLSSDTDVSTAGYFQLSWSSEHDDEYILEQSTSADFISPIEIYRGQQTATVLSGLANGEYFYRVKTPQSEWSEVVQVVVTHHTLIKAFAFFALGAVMFLILLVVLLQGRKQESLYT
jgi:hypothetical protein